MENVESLRRHNSADPLIFHSFQVILVYNLQYVLLYISIFILVINILITDLCIFASQEVSLGFDLQSQSHTFQMLFAG